MSLDETDLHVRAQFMLDHCELVNVRIVEFSARLRTSRQAVAAKVSSETSYHVDESTFANRYIWEVELIDDEQATVAEMTATFVVDYDIAKGFVPDEEAAEMIAQNTGYFAAYPYVRELFQAHTARLQLNPMVLGMLMRDTTRPLAITTA